MDIDISLDGNSGPQVRAQLLELDPQARLETISAFLTDAYTAATGMEAPAPDEPLYFESLEATDLTSRVELALDVSLPFEDLLEDMTVDGLAAQVADALENGLPAGSAPVIHLDGRMRHEPFPLTAIQQAYLLGRSGVFDLGGVATHLYWEFEHDDLNLARLGSALRRLIDRHDMLRAVIDLDGNQRILPKVKPYQIQVTDLRGVTAHEAAERLDAVREEMSHQVLPSDRWPLFDIRAHRLDERRTRLHVSIDLLIADAGSIALLMREWSLLYRELDAELPPLELSFRDYILAIEQLRGGERYESAREYWRRRLPTLPPAPELPLASERAAGSDRFVRRARTFDESVWQGLKQRASRSGVTASALLGAAYAEVLAAWSKEPRFTLNLTLGERLPLHSQVPSLIGDFTSSILLEVDASGDDSFDSRAQRLGTQLREDFEHRQFGGVEVLRELARAGGGAAATMPVVFTSMLGIGLENASDADLEPFARASYAVSQTPQVLLDNQVVARAGRLEVSWDAVEGRFLPGTLDAMFGAYCTLLERLAAGEEAVSRGSLLPAGQLRQRAEHNETSWQHSGRVLHGPVQRWARERPDAPAVISSSRTITYGQLDREANQVARLLRDRGVERGELVAVVMEKGWAQVVAALGIVRAGAAYLPADAALPAQRLHDLLDRGGVRLALTQARVDERIDWPADVEPLPVDGHERQGTVDAPVDGGAGPDDLAYVIFTSGSTGQPKGVMIDHRGAVNTIMDINDRFGVGPEDRTLAVSSLSFDLSVYDIFGPLAAGGAIVVPDAGAERDPARWADLVRERRVTIWNSVPALLDMVVEYAGGRGETTGDSLRLALLSGDWVPLDLPGRLRRLLPGCEAVSLGGATEGSIWSILYPIGEVDPGWASVPYGRAMRNQRMHVLDRDLEPRPVWVPGEICIGGTGVASGYWRDPERTAERFVRHPVTGERLYRTGDLGRVLPDGNIEFLGREDFQVKIRGHRVELGEIEAVLGEHRSVRTAVVTAAGERQGPKRLVAHYVPAGDGPVPDGDLRAVAAERLPDYMVPAAFVAHEALPLTANGKVDRGALAEAACPLAAQPGDGQPAARRRSRPGSDEEATLARIWCEMLGVERVDPDDDFFLSGGDSLLALRYISKAGAEGIRLRPEDFLEGATFGALLERAGIDPAPVGEQGLVTGEVELTPNQRWFLEQEFAEQHHWNGMWPLLSVGERLDPGLMGAAIHRLLLHHDALRMRFRRSGQGWKAVIEGPEAALPVPYSTVDLSQVPDADLDRAVEEACSRMQASLDLEEGPLIRVTYLDLGPHRPGRLHVAAHWISLDYYSSRLFLEDLRMVYEQLRRGLEPELPPKSTSVVEFGRKLAERAQAADEDLQVDYWLAPARREAATVPFDHERGPNSQGSAHRVLVSLSREETARLTDELPRRYGCEVRELILLALGRALAPWTGRDTLVVDVEGHGREDLADGVDISRTVGRYSTIWPLLLETAADGDHGEAIASVAEQVRRPRQRGVWYGIMRYLRDDPELRRRLQDLPAAAVGFNYWGQVDEYFTEGLWPSPESPGPHRSAAGQRPRPIDVLGWVAGDELALVWSYSENLHRAETIQRLAERTAAELRRLLDSDGAGQPAGAAPAAVHIDEQRPLQRDGSWRLAGMAAQRDTEGDAR